MRPKPIKNLRELREALQIGIDQLARGESGILDINEMKARLKRDVKLRAKSRLKPKRR